MSPSSFHNFRVTFLHFTFSVILFESDHCSFVSFVNLSSLSSILVLQVHNNSLNRSCLRHVLMTTQKKMCLLCTNQCVLLLSFLSIFGRHLFGNMTPKLNRGCVTFIERFIHFIHFFRLRFQEPMLLFLTVGMPD